MSDLCGVIAAAATPVGTDGEIDRKRLIEHCKWLLEAGGCDAVNLLGTTGEATSFSLQQRLEAMSHISNSGLPMSRFMVGTGAGALADAVALTRAADDLGFAGALLVPTLLLQGDQRGSGGELCSTGHRRRPCEAGQALPLSHSAVLGRPLHGQCGGTARTEEPECSEGREELVWRSFLLQRTRAAATRHRCFPSSEGTLSSADEHGFAGCISATTNVNGTLAQEAWRSKRYGRGRQAVRRR